MSDLALCMHVSVVVGMLMSHGYDVVHACQLVVDGVYPPRCGIEGEVIRWYVRLVCMCAC